RTAHPDPDAEWDRTNGRVFRLRWKDAAPAPHVDPQSLTSRELVHWLCSEDGWRVARARRVLAERQDKTILDPLRGLLASDNPLHALQAMWVLHTLGEFDERLAASLLTHAHPAVRAWGIRLRGDHSAVSVEFQERLLDVAKSETSP